MLTHGLLSPSDLIGYARGGVSRGSKGFPVDVARCGVMSTVSLTSEIIPPMRVEKPMPTIPKEAIATTPMVMPIVARTETNLCRLRFRTAR